VHGGIIGDNILSRTMKITSLWSMVTLISCSSSPEPDITQPEVIPPIQLFEFDIHQLEYSELPYISDNPVSLEINYPTDLKGVIVFEVDGTQHHHSDKIESKGLIVFEDHVTQYYHPVQIVQKALKFVDSFYKTQDSLYLFRAKLYAEKLVEISVESDDALYFPYLFNFQLHNIKSEELIFPWYSGMAQGQVLSLFMRLYRVTGNNNYLEVGEKIFRSFTHQKGETDPWIAVSDTARYLWIEEYPMGDPPHALNGFIFAIYGLYDYYIIMKDSQSKELLRASLTTVKKYVNYYRNEGDLSFYCLKHNIRSSLYHRIHTEQLEMLFKITGDSFFKQMSDNFFNDSH